MSLLAQYLETIRLANVNQTFRHRRGECGLLATRTGRALPRAAGEVGPAEWSGVGALRQALADRWSEALTAKNCGS
jgi:hypothetical protein